MTHILKVLFLILFVLCNGPNVFAQIDIYLPQPRQAKLSVGGLTLDHGIPLKALVDDPKPPEILRRIPLPPNLSVDPDFATANFSIDYIAGGGSDKWYEPCFVFPQAARDVFEAAAAVWGNILQSDVPITIEACWADLGSSSTLGYSGGGPLRRDFLGTPRANTWFSGALANALYGSDLNSSSYDMHITYNRNFNWYYGTDGNPAFNQHDLFSVVMHEIAHGLNFSGSMTMSGDVGSWGYGTEYPGIYDVFIRDASGNELITSYTNGTTQLGDALKSNGLYFHGNNAMIANGNNRVKIYAPGTWRSGSSYSHLDYATFNNTANQLMVYAISAGESIHDPGVITNGLLKDLGWQIEVSTDPDLIVSSLGVSSQSLSPEQSVTVSANVRNIGIDTADASTFRYYLSMDSTITTGDIEVGTDPVAPLASGENSSESKTLTAPATPGTYYYGGCVDAVSGESSISNNCSAAIVVVVSSSTEEPFPWELFLPAILNGRTR